MPLAAAALTLTLILALEPYAQSSSGLPSLPGQGLETTLSGSLVAALPPAPDAAPRAPAAAVPARDPAEQKFKKWTASKGMVHVYPKPSARSAFIQGENYADGQTIKVLEIVPGQNKLSWLKVLTPSNKIGYVFSGEARPANVSRSGKLVQSPNMDD